MMAAASPGPTRTFGIVPAGICSTTRSRPPPARQAARTA